MRSPRNWISQFIYFYFQFVRSRIFVYIYSLNVLYRIINYMWNENAKNGESIEKEHTCRRVINWNAFTFDNSIDIIKWKSQSNFMFCIERRCRAVWPFEWVEIVISISYRRTIIRHAYFAFSSSSSSSRRFVLFAVYTSYSSTASCKKGNKTSDK